MERVNAALELPSLAGIQKRVRGRRWRRCLNYLLFSKACEQKRLDVAEWLLAEVDGVAEMAASSTGVMHAVRNDLRAIVYRVLAAFDPPAPFELDESARTHWGRGIARERVNIETFFIGQPTDEENHWCVAPGNYAPLHMAFLIAAAMGREEIAFMFMAHPLVRVGAYGMFALELAALRDRTDLAITFLQDPRFDPNAHRRSALLIAARGGNLAIVDAFMRHPHIDKTDLDHVVADAVQCGRAAVVRRVLDDPGARVDPTRDGYRMFRAVCSTSSWNERAYGEAFWELAAHPAVDRFHEDVLVQILNFSPEAHAVRLLGSNRAWHARVDANTVMMIAIFRERPALLAFVLGWAGLDPKAADRDFVEYACRHARAPILRMLLDDRRFAPGAKALHAAVECGKHECLLLLAADARVRVDGSLLLTAVRAASPAILMLVLDFPTVRLDYNRCEALRAALARKDEVGRALVRTIIMHPKFSRMVNSSASFRRFVFEHFPAKKDERSSMRACGKECGGECGCGCDKCETNSTRGHGKQRVTAIDA